MDEIVEFIGEGAIAVMTFSVIIVMVISYFTGTSFSDYIQTLLLSFFHPDLLYHSGHQMP
mgnify:CR=1 FL=1